MAIASTSATSAASLKRIAAIDIGTVTCRLLVALTDGEQLEERVRTSIICNLGEGVDATKTLKPEAMQRVFSAIEEFKRLIAQEEACDPAPGATTIVAMATSASRDASNGDEFARGLRERGIELTIIPGSKEAALSFLGAGRDYVGEPILVSDIGGGSTEIIAGIAGQEPLFAHSFDIGCRRMTERFFAHDPQTDEEVAIARAWTREQFAPFFARMKESGFAPAHVVSVAGTATSMVSMRERMEVYDRALVHGVSVSSDDLAAIQAAIFPLPVAERMRVVGLQPERAPVINAGIVILQEVLHAAGANAFTASESDILQGIILTTAQSMR